MRDEDSPLRTLAFAAAVAFACSLLVTSTVQWLRPRQAAMQSVEYDRVILQVAGLIDESAELTDQEVVDRFLELRTRAVDLASGWYTNDVDPLSYDFRALAETGERPRYMPVYLLDGNEGIERIVLPVFGRGMWSTIFGAIALSGDLRSIAGVVFYEHGETPGIGDRIEDAQWRSEWQGKRVLDDDGNLCFEIGAPQADPACSVDGITGATMTVTAVEAMVREWFGDSGYGPFLSALRAAQAQ